MSLKPETLQFYDDMDEEVTGRRGAVLLRSLTNASECLVAYPAVEML